LNVVRVVIAGAGTALVLGAFALVVAELGDFEWLAIVGHCLLGVAVLAAFAVWLGCLWMWAL
jgi:cation transporter-like permease